MKNISSLSIIREAVLFLLLAFPFSTYGDSGEISGIQMRGAQADRSFAKSGINTERRAQADESLIFALVPKQVNNSFFDLARDGCQARAAILPQNITCLYVGPLVEGDAQAQADIVDELITRGDIDGISLSVTDAAVASEAISRCKDADIPVVTFDSDAKDSERLAYVGTNNRAFGNELGKLLDQLKPLGGNYGVISAGAPNVIQKANGVSERLADSNWVEVEESPKDCLGSIDVFYDQLWEYAATSVDAIIPVGAWPWLDNNSSRWIAFRDAHPNITMVASETLAVALDLLNKGYVDGLVGQLPFEMGSLSVDTLLKINKGEEIEENVYGTSFTEVLLFPLELPPLTVDNNHIGRLAILGYMLFGIIVFLSLGFAIWVYVKKDTRVVRASQPLFLGMICVGVLIMASAIIPLTVDDENYGQQSTDIACMSVPWLMSIGFTTTFSALFSKTWRVNKIFHNPSRFSRIKVTPKDVIGPYLALLCVNVIVLACWTAIAPLVYDRFYHAGTDSWNRPISSYGLCHSGGDAKGGFAPYLIIIAVVNVGVLVLANMQAYQARSIRTEFSESKYINIIMASMLQAFVIGFPVILLVWDLPQVYFVVMVCLISVICLAVLLFMFVPKVLFLKEKTKEKKRKDEERVKRQNSSSYFADTRENTSSMASALDDNGQSGLRIAMMTSTRLATCHGASSTVRLRRTIEENRIDENNENALRTSSGAWELP